MNGIPDGSGTFDTNRRRLGRQNNGRGEVLPNSSPVILHTNSDVNSVLTSQVPSLLGRGLPVLLRGPLTSAARSISAGPRMISDHLRSVSLPQALHYFTMSNSADVQLSESGKNSRRLLVDQQAPEHLETRTTTAEGMAATASSTGLTSNLTAAGSADSSTYRNHTLNNSSYYRQQRSITIPRDNGSDIHPGVGTESLESTPPSPVDVSSQHPLLTTPSSRSGTSKRAVSEGSQVNRNGIVHGPRPFGRSHTTPRLAYIFYYTDTELLDPLPCDGQYSLISSTSFTSSSGSKKQKRYKSIQHYSESVDFSIAEKTDDDISDPTAGVYASDSLAATATDTEAELQIAAQEVPMGATQRALANHDILKCIFEILDAFMVVPHELVQQRRKPLSLRHAQLMFGDTQRAVEAWEHKQPTTTTESPTVGLYNCLLVNSQWYDAAVRILEKRIHFRDNAHWTQFARRGVTSLTRKPRMLVLHKLNEANLVEIDLIERAQLGEHLEWLEFYTCSNLSPSPSLLGPQLTRIILPGCFRVNDRTMTFIAEKCPSLEHLDVRACEQVTDRGVKLIAKYCPQLQLLNVGRTRGGEFITYKGIKHLARQTQITTLGIAGCHVDDRAVWELALNRGVQLQRLSLNNCRLLTDSSVPRVLGYMPNLTVLEIRGCTQITHMRPLALFKAYREKQGQPPLIEGCEVIERRLQSAIMRLQREQSQRILFDLMSWANESDVEDDFVSPVSA